MLNDLVNSAHTNQGQRQQNLGSSVGKVILKPALVVNSEDPQGMGRITVRFVELDVNGNIVGKTSSQEEKTDRYSGKDKDYSDEQLPVCYPIMPSFFFGRPKRGEMVIVFLENPDDASAPRHYIGPIITSDLNLRIQLFESAYKLYDKTFFSTNPTRSQEQKKKPIFNFEESDIGIKGRNDADLMLKNKEAVLTCSRFKGSDFYEPNFDTYSFLRLKNNVKTDSNISSIKNKLKDSNADILKEFSSAELNANVVCVYSPRGKFRGNDLKKYENSKDLDSFYTFDKNPQGENLADTLHPTVFGDELIKLLNLIINIILTHIHTPQSPLLREANSIELETYTVQGKLQNLISNHVRIN